MTLEPQSGLRVENLTKAYAGRTVFADVSFAVQPGEALVLLGPSGAGKSTLLRCLNGLERADGGNVHVGGERLWSHGSARADQRALLGIRRRVGFVFQACHLFAHRTVLENVAEGPRHVRRLSVAESRERAEALLAQVGVSHRKTAYPRELSGGEQQRAAIARALAMEPQVLLMDEPTSALDDARVEGLVALLQALVGDGMAVVAASHDQRFARALGGRSLRLEAGRLGDVPPVA